MINILYIHGYGSNTHSGSLKIDQLENEFHEVYRVAPDYDLGFNSSINQTLDFIKNNNLDVDAIIGTSMGGYLASIIANALDIPYVCINPCIHPRSSLIKYGVSSDIAASYPSFRGGIKGLVIVGLKDEVINPEESISHIRSELKDMPIIQDNNADHRFNDISEYVDEIAIFIYSSIN